MMNGKTPTGALRVALEKRILNEFSAKILNEERLEQIFESRKTTHTTPYTEMSFHCECDNKACKEAILMSTEEYQHVHTRTRDFVVVPSHVQLDLEEIITEFKNYVFVGKFFPYRAG